MDKSLKFTGKIDRRSPRNEGDPNNPYWRENYISRDGKLTKIPGIQRAIDTTLTGIPRWLGKYYSIETGIVSPKTFTYTEDGKIWRVDDLARSAEVVQDNINTNAIPKHWLFKTLNQTIMYFVDGNDLWKYDGNNDYNWEKVEVTDTDGSSIEPIDVIEHKDRLWLISETYVFVSKNLFPEVFDDASDSIQIIVGSGKGKNLAMGKIEDRLYIFNTEGIFTIEGDTISALASTFVLRKVDDRRIIAGGSLKLVEKALVILADDLELWSWDGNTSKMLSYSENLKLSINPSREALNKAVATYYDNTYMVSVVETGKTEPNLEFFYDAFEDKIDPIRDRDVSCYLDIDPTREEVYQQLGHSDKETIMYANRSNNFDEEPIPTVLWTRDIVAQRGYNVRFKAFYPSFEPTGNRNITIGYWLDGRLSPPTGSSPNWSQNLQGEYKTLGAITIANQNQATGRALPKINYARGESITFYINEATKDMRTIFLGIGIDVIGKAKKKGKKVGQ